MHSTNSMGYIALDILSTWLNHERWYCTEMKKLKATQKGKRNMLENSLYINGTVYFLSIAVPSHIGKGVWVLSKTIVMASFQLFQTINVLIMPLLDCYSAFKKWGFHITYQRLKFALRSSNNISTITTISNTRSLNQLLLWKCGLF